ncbi:hypothetical protein [Anaerosinus massiliensis]|uniref:hypothetical protein n=1 Tax=Massilibacillus massiliensis TaxID=1806837 RepID=UPI000DA6088F|nr:hypothetical protein [Massilibacillus massiliensis]
MENERQVIPRCIKVFPQDNVAVVASEGGLKQGTMVENILLLDDVPQGHKIALCPIAKGEAARAAKSSTA